MSTFRFARFTFSRLVLGALIFLLLKGDGGGGCCAAESSLGPPTETPCPPTSSLTYANFGQAFMMTYCTRCHDQALTGDARMGAPAYHDFDTQAGVQRVANHIDETAGSGPAATNMSMPPSGSKPTLAEREMLAEWIACGAN